MTIPRLLHHIWIGPHEPPYAWMETWPKAHPAWTYRIWSNTDLRQRGWINWKLMQHYIARQQWAGVADLMRYEILLHCGGVVLAADSICVNPIDELFDDRYSLYTISTEYSGNRHKANIGATTPLYAATPHHPFTALLIGALHSVRRPGTPNRTTGNRFMQYMLKRYRPSIKVWPMHYFISDHFNGWKYDGPDRVYARHFWGTTRNTYEQGRIIQ